MEKLDYYKLRAYFKDIVTKYQGIDTFIGFNEKELFTEINRKESDTGFKLVLFKYEGALNGNLQRTLAGRIVHFAVVKHTKVNDFNQEAIDIAACENRGFAVLSRILYDSRNPQSTWLYNNFDANEVGFNEIRLKSGKGLVGVEFSFVLKTPQPLRLNVDEWKDLEGI